MSRPSTVVQCLLSAAAVMLAGVLTVHSPTLWFPVLTVALFGVSLMLVMRLSRLSRRLFRLCNDYVTTLRPASLDEAANHIEALLVEIAHRGEARHPVTRLPTRERLFQRIAADLREETAMAMLAVLRIADHDRLRHAMRDAAMGNLDFRLSHRRRDEFGELFDAYNVFVDTVQDRLDVAEREKIVGTRPLDSTRIDLAAAKSSKTPANTPFASEWRQQA